MIRPLCLLGSYVPAFVLSAMTAMAQEGGPPAVTLRFQIHNGPQADRYEAESQDAPCRVEGTGGDTLVTAFRPDFPSAVTWFALVVPDPHDATRGTTAFRLEFMIESLRMGRVRYTVERRPDRRARGSGSVTLTFDDERTTAQFAVRTEGSMDVSGTVICSGRS